MELLKIIFCVVVMLVVTPIIAVIGLVSFDPDNWGGTPTIQSVLGMAFLGLITVPVWITYIPSLVIAPIIMKKISYTPTFYSLGLLKFSGISVVVGALGGIIILLPCIILAAADSIKLTANWTWAGAFSGAVTFTIIALAYGFVNQVRRLD